MSDRKFLEFQSSSSPAVVPGFWKLTTGRALSLQPRQAGILRIAQGHVWATINVKHCGHGNELGDHFLQAGQQISVKAGQHLVFEPLDTHSHEAVYFEWTPAPALASARVLRNAHGVIQPLRDLSLALGLVGGALVRLGAGLVGYGRQLVSGRPPLQAPHCG